MICFLSGCKQPYKKQEQWDRSEFQARCIDLPFPLDVQLQDKGIISSGEHDAKFFVHYITKSSMQQLQAFYQAEMEFAGWREQAKFIENDDEMVYIFDKPHKLALIIISDSGKQRCVRCLSRS